MLLPLWRDKYILLTSFTCACSACLRVRFWLIVCENSRVKLWRFVPVSRIKALKLQQASFRFSHGTQRGAVKATKRLKASRKRKKGKGWIAADDLDRLKAIRGGHPGVAIKLIRQAEEILESIFLLTEDYEYVFVIYQQLDTKLQTLNDYDQQILNVCNVMTDIKAEIDDSQRATEKVVACKRKIDLKLKQKWSGSGDNHSERFSNTGQVPATTSQAIAKLPKLTLPKFWEFTKCNTFWDSFQFAVHDNPEISQVDKFDYLNSVLEEPAARSIAGLTLTASNYENAVWILQDRFGKTQQIITAHRDELIKITPCHNDRPKSLRYAFDQLSVHTRGLDSLGASPEQYGSLLIPIIMPKLPNEIRLQVARNSTDEVW